MGVADGLGYGGESRHALPQQSNASIAGGRWLQRVLALDGDAGVSVGNSGRLMLGGSRIRPRTPRCRSGERKQPRTPGDAGVSIGALSGDSGCPECAIQRQRTSSR